LKEGLAEMPPAKLVGFVAGAVASMTLVEEQTEDDIEGEYANFVSGWVTHYAGFAADKWTNTSAVAPTTDEEDEHPPLEIVARDYNVRALLLSHYNHITKEWAPG
jgi:hypothetical protein